MEETSDRGAKAPPKTEIERLRDELHLVKTAGIIEIAVRNPSVADYMDHWEGRALKAEAIYREMIAISSSTRGE